MVQIFLNSCCIHSGFSTERTTSRRTPTMGGRNSSPSQDASPNIWADPLLHLFLTGCNQLQEKNTGELSWWRKLQPGILLEIFSEALCAWGASYIPVYQLRRLCLCSAEATLTYFWMTVSIKHNPPLSVKPCCPGEIGHLSWMQDLDLNTEFFRYYLPSFWFQEETNLE